MTTIKDFVGTDKTARIPNFSDKISKKAPGLGTSVGYKLSPDELKNWFGINPSRFGDLPTRFVLPELNVTWLYKKTYKTYGQLYVIEPIEWVPFVALADTQPKSRFLTEFKGVKTTVSETDFSAKAYASLTVEVGGGWGPVSASAKAGVETSIETKMSSRLEESVTTTGTSGNRPVHLVKLLPRLRCRIIKHQLFETRYWDDLSRYTSFEPMYRSILDGDGEEIASEMNRFTQQNQVHDERMSAIKPLVMDPVFIRGDTAEQWYGKCLKICPVPFFKDSHSTDPDWFTLVAGWTWHNFYLYDREWKDGPLPGELDTVIMDVQGAGAVAFRSGATWVADEELPGN